MCVAGQELIPPSLLTLIRKSDVEKERSKKQQRSKWYEHGNVAERGSVGSGNLRGGRIGDARRTDRLVKVGSVLGENPSVSLPRSMRNWADTHAAYQFLGNSAVSHEQIMAPHFAATYQEAAERSQVLLLGDTTDVNLSTHKATTGLGPVGRGNKAQGFFVHSVLAIDAKNKQLLGCMGQEPFVREPAPEKETRAEYQ